MSALESGAFGAMMIRVRAALADSDSGRTGRSPARRRMSLEQQSSSPKNPLFGSFLGVNLPHE
jgi:hypothetical protein